MLAETLAPAPTQNPDFAAIQLAPRHAALAAIQDPSIQKFFGVVLTTTVENESAVRRSFKRMAKSLLAIEEQLLDEDEPQADHPARVARLAAETASKADANALDYMSAHFAIESMALAFASDGTYADYALNADYLGKLVTAVGKLQAEARAATRSFAPGLAIDWALMAAKKDKGAEFQEARLAYEAARDAHNVTNAAYLALHEAAEAEAPIPEALCTTAYRHELRSAVAIDNASWLTFERKAELFGVLREWEARRCEARERHNVQEAEKRRNETDVAMGEACERLMCATPGSAEDLAYMARIAIDAFTQGTEEHPDDPRMIQRILYEGDYQEVMAARLYIAALRLAGENSPVTDVEPFDPEAWLNEFEVATGLRISDKRGPEYREQDDPQSDTYKVASARWRDLRKWQKEAVASVAEERHQDMDYAAGPYSRAHDLIAIVEDHGGKFVMRDEQLVLDRQGRAREAYLRVIDDALDTFPDKKAAIVAVLTGTDQQVAA